MALLIERNDPDGHQEIVSAVQLARTMPSHESPGMVRVLCIQALERLRDVRFGDLLRPRRTVRVWGIAAVLTLGFAGAGLAGSESFPIWAARLFGADLPYPRATFLTISIPEAGTTLTQVEDEGPGGPLRVRIARGAELPVQVDVRGQVPEAVELEIRARDRDDLFQRVLMSQRGPERFRFVLRRTISDLELRAFGGDDPGTRTVIVEVLPPPAVTHLSHRVQPPAYTRLEPIEREGGLIEALPGSLVEVHMHTSVPLEEGALVFQETGQRVPLELVSDGGDGDIGGGDVIGDGQRGPHYRASFGMPEAADRYRIELLARNGLRDLSKGVHSVVPIPDHRPQLRVLAPGPALGAVLPGATIPLRLLASDDFGLERIELLVRLSEKDEPLVQVLFAADEAGEPVRSQGVLRFLVPTGLFPEQDRKPREGEQLQLELVVRDNRQPEHQDSHPRRIALGLVDAEELSRRLQSELRSTRDLVESAAKIQHRQREQCGAIIAGLAEGGDAPGSRRPMLSSLDAGQRRVQALLRRIRSSLVDSFEAHLFNGLDDSPPVREVLESWKAWYEARPEAPPGDLAWHESLAQARRDGRIGRMEVLGRLCDMFELAHALHDGEAELAMEALHEAGAAGDTKAMGAALDLVARSQDKLIEGLSRLLEMLEEWNDFQDVIRTTRQLREIQQRILDETKRR
ncbi:MAG: hypothetical protein R3F30_08575 [Planctomycetota bacterium]